MQRNLLDNDIVLKLSQYFLKDEFFEICAPPESIFILPTLKYRFHLNDLVKALKIVKDKHALADLMEFVGMINEVEDEAPIELLAQFSGIDQIDQGEAVLFALTALNDQSITITGDKRALKALAELGGVSGALGLLQGRLKCFEQIIAELLLSRHEEIIIKKVSGHHWDMAMHICFSLGKAGDALEGLQSYYNKVNGECMNLLVPFPE